MPTTSKSSNPQNRPLTTLFMLQSLDGKISTGDRDELDFDKDLPRVPGVMEGLEQYYEIEKTTDLYSLNTGRVMAKIGVNTLTFEPAKIQVTFIIIDNKPHLNISGLTYLAKWVKKLIIVTTNPTHPAYQLQESFPNILIRFFDTRIDFQTLFADLTSTYKIKRLTIQSGGTLNAHLIRNGLIDRVSVVVAPCLIGGTNTSSLVGGESLHTKEDLKLIQALELESCTVLENSYLHLVYNLRS